MDLMIKNRLNIPLSAESFLKFYTSTGLLICRGYLRVVIGGRGPYVEFDDSQIIKESIKIPRDQEWRLNSENAYYIEFRSIDKANIKVYHQRKRVGYADYKIDLYYMSPFDLFLKDGSGVID